MRFEFIGKAEVANISNNRFKRVMLTIGIVCLLFAMIVEFILGNKSAWAFMVPTIYLVSLRNQISKKKSIIDIPINMSIDQEKIEFVFNNTIRNKTGNFSEKFIFEISDVEKCNYLRKCRELQILTNSQYCILNESSVEKGKTRVRNIRFQLPKDKEDTILNELTRIITIDYFE